MMRAAQCPYCKADQSKVKRRMLLFGGRIATCSQCGRSFEVSGRRWVDGAVGGGLSVLVLVALFLAWAKSSWLWLLLPVAWWLLLDFMAYMFLPLVEHRKSDRSQPGDDVPVAEQR